MRKKLKENKIFSVRFLLTLLLAWTIVLAALNTLFVNFVKQIKNNMIDEGKQTIQESADEIYDYILNGINIANIMEESLNQLSSEGCGQEEIQSYMDRQTEIYQNLYGEADYKVYAVVDDVYYTTTGFEPDSDYDPYSRPWYRAAEEAGGEIALVSPYEDIQTGEIILSISKMLPNRMDAVSIDMNMTALQTMVEGMKTETYETTMVLGGNGIVVACSDVDEVGNNYLEDSSSKWSGITGSVYEGKKTFTFQSGKQTYRGFSEEMADGWYAVTIVKSSHYFKNITIMGILLGLVDLLVAYGILILLIQITNLQQTAKTYRELSRKDAMTGLLNHGSGEGMVRDCVTAGKKGAFIILDVDKFKSINDNYGHTAGDSVILALADVLRNSFRDDDIVFRLGGDEFAIYAMGVANEETAECIMERVLKKIYSMEVEELTQWEVELSIGITFCDRPENFEVVYRRADAAVYESKKIKGNAISFRYAGDKQ